MCQWRLSAPQQTSILYSITSSARPGIRHSRNETLWKVRAASLWLDVGRPDHLAPLLGFVGDEPAKVGGREHKWCAPHVGEPRLHFGIEEASGDLLVEFLDDLGGRGLRCADAEPGARLETRHEFVYSRDVGQRVRAMTYGALMMLATGAISRMKLKLSLS